MIVCGQEITRDIVDRIQDAIRCEPSISRGELSRRLCEWSDWRSPSGKAKVMSARVALNRLAKADLIELPAVDRAIPLRCDTNTTISSFCSPQVSGSLESLGDIRIAKVASRGSKAAQTWRSMLERYHYLGSGPLCGAQLRYLIESQKYGPVGGLAFSSATLRLGPRDKWLGWSAHARRSNIDQVICNSRFLILPEVEVKNLASHALSLAMSRIVDDWYDRYGIRPQLIETYVDPRRFDGASYKAANWHFIGKTSGRRAGEVEGAKDIYIYPLCRNCRSTLQCEQPPTELKAAPEPLEEGVDWAEQELGRADFGDPRLTRRLVEIARNFYAAPQGNIPQASRNRAGAKGTYRFIENKVTNMDDVLRPHYESTIRRCREQSVVLAVQDTTSLNYTGLASCQGLGKIGTNNTSAVGLELHDTMAINIQGTPLGLLDVQCWAREEDVHTDPDEHKAWKAEKKKQPIEKKESFKWLKSFRAVAQAQKSCPETMLVSVGDREADIHELFVDTKNINNAPKLLIRAVQPRKVITEHGIEEIWNHVQRQSLAGMALIQVPRKGKQKSRTAEFHIRFAEVTIKAPKDKPNLGSVKLCAILAKEVNPPKGVEPIEWKLLTNVPTLTPEDALTRIKWYALRWGIEVYHKTLKSGCRIEDRQLNSADSLQTCLAIDMVVAWRVYHVTKLAREFPDEPATLYFDPDEVQALVLRTQTMNTFANRMLTMREMTRLLASLGGFLGRKGDGEPGIKSIWIAIQRLDDITRTYRATLAMLGLNQKPPP